RRNRPQVIAAGLVLLALVGGIVGTTLGLLHADTKRWEAEQARSNEATQRGIAEERTLAALAAAEEGRKAKNAEKDARLKETEERTYAEAIAAFVRDDFLALTSLEGQERFAGEYPVELDSNLTMLQMLHRAAEKLDARKDLAPRTEADLRW